MEDYDITEYSSYLQSAGSKLTSMDDRADRFVAFHKRDERTVLTMDAFKNLSHGKWQTFWKGLHLLQNPIDLAIYQRLLWDLKPKSVIEIGAYNGGMAVWLADMIQVFGFAETRVYSMEINMDLIDPKATADHRITFINGDCRKPEATFTKEMVKALPKPWLILEDAHVNLCGLLEHFHQFLTKGDYIVVEDTNPMGPATNDAGLADVYWPVGPRKLLEVGKFTEKHGDTYKVDTKYTDFFGYNGSQMFNSILKRMI